MRGTDQLRKSAISSHRPNILQDMVVSGRFAHVHFECTLVHLMLAQTPLAIRHAKGQCPAGRTVGRFFEVMGSNRI